jgi:spoIIIJ-associated protein
MKDETKKLLDDLILKSGFDVVKTEVILDETGSYYWYHIETSEPKYLIGHNGETLQALNHIARRMLETTETAEDKTILIDVNNYQKTRVDNLKTIAHMMAERARFFKSSVEIDPMTAFERKIIHTFLENKNDIKTESTGIGRDRRVVIRYIGNI